MTGLETKSTICRRGALGLLAGASLAPTFAKEAAAVRGVDLRAPRIQRRQFLETSWDRRFLRLRRSETGERFRGVYFEHGAENKREMWKIRWLLRDVRAAATHPIDPDLLELLRRLQQNCEGREIIVTSAFRTPQTNNLLRSRGAVRTSLHLSGQAVDFFVVNEPLNRVAKLLEAEELGGVGLYNRRGFIHADLGRVRFWRG